MEDSIMKKALLLIMTLAYCIISSAAHPPDSWVITKNGKMDCKYIRVGTSKAKILLQDGKKITIPLVQINSYSLNGKVFRRLSINRNGKHSNEMIFMELLKTKDGYSLYKHNRHDDESPYDCYYIYRDDQFCYALDKSMAPNRIKNLLNYFGYRVVFA